MFGILNQCWTEGRWSSKGRGNRIHEVSLVNTRTHFKPHLYENRQNMGTEEKGRVLAFSVCTFRSSLILQEDLIRTSHV